MISTRGASTAEGEGGTHERRDWKWAKECGTADIAFEHGPMDPPKFHMQPCDRSLVEQAGRDRR